MTRGELTGIDGAPVRCLLLSSGDVPADDAWLAPAECAHLARLRVAKRQADWRLGRWTAKRAVSAALSAPVDRIAVIATAGGAPLALLDGVPAPVAISISHAAGRGLCAVAPAGMSVGCDLEAVVRRDPAFARDYLTAAEQVWAADDARRVTRLWSAKEAALKAVGEGLREDPRAVEVTAGDGPADTWSALALTVAGRRLRGWGRDLEELVAAVVLA